jgi:hypothetical protein
VHWNLETSPWVSIGFAWKSKLYPINQALKWEYISVTSGANKHHCHVESAMTYLRYRSEFHSEPPLQDWGYCAASTIQGYRYGKNIQNVLEASYHQPFWIPIKWGVKFLFLNWQNEMYWILFLIPRINPKFEGYNRTGDITWDDSLLVTYQITRRAEWSHKY